MANPSTAPLIVVVSGGGPVGLTFSLNLTMMMGKHAKIIIYEGRWFVNASGVTQWQGEEQGKNRRDQVVTLQDHVIKQMRAYVQEGLFKNFNERVWPTSRNIPIREVEDRLFELIQPFVQNGQVELVAEQLQAKSECILQGGFDILIGADGSNSFVRGYCNIPWVSEGLEYACGVAYKIPSQVPNLEEPLHQALNCILTVSQTRYLVNSSTSRRGYLNIRLIKTEYDELKERLEISQSRNEPLDLLDYDKCPQSPVWTIIRQGLIYFKIDPKFVFRVVPIEINVRHASIVVRELRFEVQETQNENAASLPPPGSITPPASNATGRRKKYKTVIVCLAGDAAMNVHFWPGRGMNSGMKAAIALARNILRSCTVETPQRAIVVRTPLPFLSFLDYEGFMARLRAREQQGRSLRVLIDPIDQSVEESYSYAAMSHCYQKYSKRLIRKLIETRDNLQKRPEWPHQTKSVTDGELESASKRIAPNAVAQLSLANPWPTREMSGVEVKVEHTFPFDQSNFLPIPATAKPMMIRAPSILVRQRFISLWVVGGMSERIKKLINVIQKLPNFVGQSSLSASSLLAPTTNTSNQAYAQLNVVETIARATEWIKANRDLIRKQGVLFKVVTLWSVSNDKTAVDVIRAVRAEEPHVPVLIFTNEREEVSPALEFPNVTATELIFDLYEFVGANQETQWNPGCLVTHKNADVKPKEETPTKTTSNDTSGNPQKPVQPYPCPYPVTSSPKLAHEPTPPSGYLQQFPFPVVASPSPPPPTPRENSKNLAKPVVLWIDSNQSDLTTATALRKAHSELEIQFVPTLSEARAYVNTNLRDLKHRSKFLVICRGRYASESKTFQDVVRLFNEQLSLAVPIGVYTSNREALKKAEPNIPEGVEIFDQENDLLAYVKKHLSN